MAFETDAINAVDFSTSGNVNLQGTVTTANTIYLGGLALTNEGGNTISFGGQPLVSSEPGGNISTGGDIITTANISGDNILANYLFGDGSNITGVVSSYGNSQVETLLSSQTLASDIYTSGSISGNNAQFTNNINAGHLVINGNNTEISTDNGQRIQIDNLTFFQANIRAESDIVFDNGGNIAGAGNIHGQYLISGVATQLATYADSSTRDSIITSPVVGMMILTNLIPQVYTGTGVDNGWGNITLV